MKLNRQAREELVELLKYIAAEDPLLSLKHAKGFDTKGARNSLQNLAHHLEAELQVERAGEMEFLQDGITAQAKQIMGTLSPREESLLMRSFRFN